MTDNTLTDLMCIALGYANGLLLGWLLWRRPQLKYKESKHD